MFAFDSPGFGFSFLPTKLLLNGKLHLILEDYGGERRLFFDFMEAYDSVIAEGCGSNELDGTSLTIYFSSQQVSTSELINQQSARYQISELEVHDPDFEKTIRRSYEDMLLDE